MGFGATMGRPRGDQWATVGRQADDPRARTAWTARSATTAARTTPARRDEPVLAEGEARETPPPPPRIGGRERRAGGGEREGRVCAEGERDERKNRCARGAILRDRSRFRLS